MVHANRSMLPLASIDPRRWWALAVLAAAQFMIVLDATIVNVGLAAIQRDLTFSPEDLTWVVNAYVLAFGSLLLLGGRIGDRLGRRTVFTVGLGLFATASLACGLAESEAVLIGARAVQGLAAALIAPTALALILATFRDTRERGVALGVWGGVAGIAGAAGALLGGVLTQHAGWEWIFLINIPFAVVAGLVGLWAVRESREVGVGSQFGFDLPGAAQVTAGLAALVYGIIGVNEHGWLAGRAPGLGALALVLLVAFAFTFEEHRTANPVVAFDIFRNRSVSVGNILGVLVGGAIVTSMFYFCTLYLQVVLGMSSQEAGLSFLPLSFVTILSAGATAPLIARFGVRPVLSVGFALLSAALIWFSMVDAARSFVADFLAPSLLAALGLGPLLVGVTVAATADVPVRHVGLASGLISAAERVGGAIGLAILSTVVSSRTGDAATAVGESPDAYRAALTEGYAAGFIGVALIMLAGAVVALVFLPRRSASTAIAIAVSPAD